MKACFLEGLAFFGIYRLMADAAPKYAHIYRAGIFGYIWLAPIGCHMNVGLLNYASKTLLQLDPAVASMAAKVMIVQFKAFSKGLTPYPKRAKWFTLVVGAVPVLIITAIIGPKTALGGGVGTTFLSVGNAFTFGGLLATLPGQERFDEFKRSLGI